jgi:hypothetical protein
MRELLEYLNDYCLLKDWSTELVNLLDRKFALPLCIHFPTHPPPFRCGVMTGFSDFLANIEVATFRL